MKFYRSTRSLAEHGDGLRRRFFAGIAPDGGLYTPAAFADMQVSMDEFAGQTGAGDLRAADAGSAAGRVFGGGDCAAWCEEGYAGKFETEELAPLIRTSGDALRAGAVPRAHVGAFKDVALSLLPRLMALSREEAGRGRGDSSCSPPPAATRARRRWRASAACRARASSCSIPKTGVSDVQRAQMVTQRGRKRARSAPCAAILTTRRQA